MKNNIKIAAYALTLGSFAFAMSLATPTSTVDQSTKQGNSTYIINLDDGLLGDENEVAKEQDSFLEHLSHTMGFNYSLKDTFKNAINAVTIVAPSGIESYLKTLPGVKNVYVNDYYRFGTESEGVNQTLDGNSDEDYTLTDEQKTNYSALTMKKKEGTNEGAGTLIAILDASFRIDHSRFQDLDPASVDLKLTKSEVKDIVTGSDFIGQPKGGIAQGDLGSTYKNNKIPFYYDYAGDSEHNEQNDYDVASDWDEHGTHVASIAAANGVYKGIAPNAQLALMKVFLEQYTESDGVTTVSIGAYDADILEALEDAALLGVDVVNMSLGTDLDDFTSRSASSQAFANLKEDGTVVSISAGNGGKELYSSMGPYSGWTTDSLETGVLGSYANDSSANIIASSNLDENYYEDALMVDYEDGDETKTQPVAYKDQSKTAESPNVTPEDLKLSYLKTKYGKDTFSFVYIGDYGKSSGYSAFEATQGEDFTFSDKIAVVDRGDISFSDKATYAYNAGCIALVVINNDPTAIEFNFSMAWGDSTGYTYPKIPVVFVLNRDRSYFTSNDGIGSLKVAEKVVQDNPDKDKVSDYSSDGPTYDLRLNPTITTPGNSVLGAVPGKADSTGKYETNNNAWAYLSGTSMAAPNFSGASALIIGEKTKDMSEEDRTAFAKTLSERTMTTADQLATDNYDKTGETLLEEGVAYSPRRQGAGQINIADTIDSSVYFEGLEVEDDGTYSSTTTGKAAVELKDNDLVKEGKLSLKFQAINEGSTARSYDVTLSIMRPETKEYRNYENHKEDATGESDHGTDYKFEGTTLQTTHDTLIKNVTFTSTIQPGANTLDFEASLTDEEKAVLDETFPNGTYLEGYLTFTPKDSVDDVELSIPYLGFYGEDEGGNSKYKTASTIEKFDFEKGADDGYYPSDLVNYVGYGSTLNLTNMDISSTIVSMSKDDYNAIQGSTALLYNEGNVKNLASTVAYNSSTNTLYAGSTSNDVLYIQAFVLRSVSTNSITITNDRGQVVKTAGDKALEDVISGGSSLYKSMVGSSYVNSGVIAHRAAAVIPLYYESNPNAKLPDGNYTLNISLTSLGSGYTEKKSYNLVIDSTSPNFVEKSTISKDGEDYLRLKYDEKYLTVENTSGLTVVSINGGNIPFDLSKYATGYYLDVKLSDIYANSEEGKVAVSITDAAGNKIFNVFYMEDYGDKSSVMVDSTELVPGAEVKRKLTDFTAEEGYNGGYKIDESYKLTYKDATGLTLKLSKPYYVYLTVDADVSTLEVYEGDDGATDTPITYEVVNSNTVRFKSTSGEFYLRANGEAEKVYYGKSSSLGLILGIAIPVAVVVAGGIATGLYFFLKKKKVK
jgi:lactocepin